MSVGCQESTHRTIERVARESLRSSGGIPSSHTRDVASAEDTLNDALVAALTTWPQDGVPQNPEAWLLTSARHSFIDLVRHRRVTEASGPTLLLLRDELRAMTLSAEFPDERLKLLFVRAHPAIDPVCTRRSCSRPFWALTPRASPMLFLVSLTTIGATPGACQDEDPRRGDSRCGNASVYTGWVAR
jgi:RNA polymerase sigma-70 factor, ECF subfamily